MPVIREPGLTSDDVRTRGGTQTIGAPEYALAVTNPDEPEPPTPPHPPTTPCARPLMPVALSPAQGASNRFPLGLTLNWSATGATGYTVWLNDLFQGFQTGTSFATVGLQINSTYLWRIDALNDCGITFGNQWTFSTANRMAPTPPNKAAAASPANGATGVSAILATTLQWANGGGALSYDVYLNGVFQGNQAGTSYNAGVLSAFTSYTWRIDPVNIDGTTVGTLWSFTTGSAYIPVYPGKAAIISPTNGGTGVSITPTLIWSAGANTLSYNVYFNGAFVGNQAGLSYVPGTLASLTAYSWRIDSVNTDGVTPGDTWSFTTGAVTPAAQWAARVVVNGGAAPAAATVTALDTFYTGLVSAGLDAKMLAVNCYVPDSLIAALTPLIKGPGNDPWTNMGSFVVGDLTVNGLKGDGVGKYLKTGVIPSGNLTYASLGLSTYLYFSGMPASIVELGAVTSSGTYTVNVMALYANSSTQAFVWDAPYAVGGAGRLTGVSPGAGYYSGNRTSDTVSLLYFANSSNAHAQLGATNTYNAGADAVPTTEIYAFAMNNGGALSGYSSSRASFAAIHTGLSGAESAALYALVHALRTALGGGTAPVASDSMESYSDTAAVNALNGGTGQWGGAYSAN